MNLMSELPHLSLKGWGEAWEYDESRTLVWDDDLERVIAKLLKMEEAKIRVGVDDEYVHGSVFHMERMDDDHIWFRIGDQAFDLYGKRGKLIWAPQNADNSWEALAGENDRS